MLISRAVPCVPSTFLQVAAEFYLRPRTIEVAASGPGSSAYASRHPVDYIHVTYDYDKLFYEAIWSLESGQLLYQSSLDLIGINVSCDSFHGRMPINNYIGNKLCFPANAADLITVIPGLKPDDNVVLVEITLNPGVHKSQFL